MTRDNLYGGYDGSPVEYGVSEFTQYLEDAGMTTREAQVLSRARLGKDTDEIASDLDVSESTVRRHKQQAEDRAMRAHRLDDALTAGLGISALLVDGNVYIPDLDSGFNTEGYGVRFCSNDSDSYYQVKRSSWPSGDSECEFMSREKEEKIYKISGADEFETLFSDCEPYSCFESAVGLYELASMVFDISAFEELYPNEYDGSRFTETIETRLGGGFQVYDDYPDKPPEARLDAE